MGKVWRGRCLAEPAWWRHSGRDCRRCVVLYGAAQGRSIAVPAKPVVELSPIDAPPPGTEAVEMFAAMDRGDLAVRLMPEKDQQARLELENRTDRPLTVQVPATFGGRFISGRQPPVAAAGLPQRTRGSFTGGQPRAAALLHSAGKGRVLSGQDRMS